MTLTSWIVLIAAVLGFVGCDTQCNTYKNCAECKDAKLCSPACANFGVAKTCICKCYHPCARDGDCPSVPAIGGRSPQCSDDGCNAYFGGSNATNCPDQQYPCRTKSDTAKGIYFYKKCRNDAQCAMGWKGCKADCKPLCAIGHNGNYFCACICPGATKQCVNSASCAMCNYRTACDRGCLEVDGVKTCVCQCRYPCDTDTNCPESPILGKAANCYNDSGTIVGCFVDYASTQSCCPTSDYRCDTYQRSLNGQLVEEKAIFLYRKCEMDSECAAILTKCAQLLGIGCVPKCTVNYNNKKFCTCLCAGTAS